VCQGYDRDVRVYMCVRGGYDRDVRVYMCVRGMTGM
jgi:hypothetical protein